MTRLRNAACAVPQETAGAAGSGREWTKASIIQALRDQIADHKLPPGSRIQEVQLATEFGISRTVVREVLTALDEHGVIERIPNRGAIVKRLDLKEIHEVFEVREVLEGMCVRLATARAPDGVWDGFIKEFGAPLERAVSDGDIDAYNDALDRLRDELVHHAGNRHAAQMLSVVLDKARIIKKRVTLLPGRADYGRRAHFEMLERMIARDADGAEAIKREIVRSARECVERYHSLIW